MRDRSMDRELVTISKSLSLVLHHKPETIGLTVDRGGWALVGESLAQANESGVSLSQGLLCQIAFPDS